MPVLRLGKENEWKGSKRGRLSGKIKLQKLCMYPFLGEPKVSLLVPEKSEEGWITLCDLVFVNLFKQHPLPLEN